MTTNDNSNPIPFVQPIETFSYWDKTRQFTFHAARHVYAFDRDDVAEAVQSVYQGADFVVMTECNSGKLYRVPEEALDHFMEWNKLPPSPSLVNHRQMRVNEADEVQGPRCRHHFLLDRGCPWTWCTGYPKTTETTPATPVSEYCESADEEEWGGPSGPYVPRVTDAPRRPALASRFTSPSRPAGTAGKALSERFSAMDSKASQVEPVDLMSSEDEEPVKRKSRSPPRTAAKRAIPIGEGDTVCYRRHHYSIHSGVDGSWPKCNYSGPCDCGITCFRGYHFSVFPDPEQYPESRICGPCDC